MHRENLNQPTNPEHQPETPPGIWVGSLSDYNNGVLFGAWIDPARDAEEVRADITAMLSGSPTAAANGLAAEEFGIFDYEGFDPLKLGEYESIDYVAQVARGIAEYGTSYAAWAVVADRDELDEYEDRFVAHVSRVDEYVEDMVADLGYDQLLDEVIPPSIRPYVQIDTLALARDMQLGGDLAVVSDAQGGYWLFHTH